MIPTIYVQMFFCFVAGFLLHTAISTDDSVKSELYLLCMFALGIFGAALGLSTY